MREAATKILKPCEAGGRTPQPNREVYKIIKLAPQPNWEVYKMTKLALRPKWEVKNKETKLTMNVGIN